MNCRDTEDSDSGTSESDDLSSSCYISHSKPPPVFKKKGLRYVPGSMYCVQAYHE